MPFFRGPPALDREGRLWVEQYGHVGETRTFWVVDLDGRILGSVEVPDRFTILEVGADHLLGSWRNDLDVEFVQLYELRTPPE